MARILVVEDDQVLGGLIRKALQSAQFEVTLVPDGRTGMKEAREGAYAAILLDLMLPGLDGSAICRELRARRRTVPILMLTARDSVEDRVRGLEDGADDYVVKPFDMRELLARLRVMLRRDRLHRTRVVRVADLEIDTTSRQARREGRELPLTPREYALLELLASNEGRVISREVIQTRLWADDDGSPATVNVHLANLRKKVDAGHEVKLIQTIHGVGYSLRVHTDPAVGQEG